MHWLYLYFPQLQLDRLQALTPALESRATVLYDPQDRKQAVVQSNTKARECGVYSGTPLARAWLLAEDMAAYPWKELEQNQQLRQLATHIYQGFSDIYLDPPDGLWLNLQPMRRVYPNAAAWQKALHVQLHPFAVHVKQGVHVSPAAARLLARFEASHIDEILIEQLPCEHKQIEKLVRFGLHTLEDLKAIPRKEIGRKLGQDIVLLLAQLEGHHRMRLAPYQPPHSFYQRIVLPSEAESWQGLQFSLKRVFRELERFLQGRGKAATKLVIHLYFREQPKQELVVSAPHGCVTTDEFLSLCQLKAEHEVLKAPVVELSVHAKGWKNHEAVMADLWNQHTSTSVPLHQLLNQLQLRMGTERVYAIQTQHYWLPELSWQRRLAGQPIQPSHDREEVIRRPAWLCLHAQRIDIHEWQLGLGPERIRTSWWQTGEESTRDYYQARHLSGRLGWVFYCYRQSCWWLQGWFS
ncbi:MULTISPECIES: DNA polymerase Y family protein [Gammaproteobacteria]|uniref:Y-family DNA polymerase n=1 Tax=Gammaproteobacteria TaxID=1236 RepID=UPI000DCFCDCE|nr:MULTISPECIES: DNA polymerase Y family protein [Gammaproteobacteria]RTE86766.1 DNA polymerase Y family protein [Aliidiomarina sp. B3213]TCZ90680.1 DNA polymerase Y family protein [Lysobacter sp. N42]